MIFEEKTFKVCVRTFSFLLTSRILDHSPRSSKDFEKCDAPERNYNWIRTVYRKAMNTATNTYIYLESDIYSYTMIETFTSMMYYHEKM